MLHRSREQERKRQRLKRLRRIERGKVGRKVYRKLLHREHDRCKAEHEAAGKALKELAEKQHYGDLGDGHEGKDFAHIGLVAADVPDKLDKEVAQQRVREVYERNAGEKDDKALVLRNENSKGA